MSTQPPVNLVDSASDNKRFSARISLDPLRIQLPTRLNPTKKTSPGVEGLATHPERQFVIPTEPTFTWLTG